MIIRPFLLTLLISTFLACGSTAPTTDDGGAGSGATGGGSATGGGTATGGGDGVDPGTIITVLHLNDLHAHLVPHAVLVQAGGDGVVGAGTKTVLRGGVARLKTLIDRERAAADASVLVNVGDTWHGGVEALYTQGEAITPAVNALGIDVGVPGNWDYAFGPNVTRLRFLGVGPIGMTECIQLGISSNMGGQVGGVQGPSNIVRPNYPVLAANVTFKHSNGFGPLIATTEGQQFLPPTRLQTVGGVKFGFIGLTSDIVPRMHPMLACGLNFLGAPELAAGDEAGWMNAYRGLVTSLSTQLKQQGAQVIIVLSELSIQKDLALANALAQGTVDAFLSAHTHEASFTPRVSSSGAWVMESGDDTYVGRLRFRVNNGAVSRLDWALLPVTMSLAEDGAMKQLVDAARAPFLAANPNLLIPGNTGGQLLLSEPITHVIGHTTHALTRKHALDSSFNDFFTEALRQRAGTQLGMAPGFRFDAPIAVAGDTVEDGAVANGEVTLEDAYRFFPVVYGMGTAETTGAHLKSVVEKALTAVFTTHVALQNGGWVEGFAGVNFDVDVQAADGSRVQAARLNDGGALVDTTTYTIAGCRRPLDATGVLCSHDGFTSVTNLLNSDGGVVSNVEVLRDGLAGASAPRPAFHDLSPQTWWPESPWVQPIEGAK